MLNNYDEVDAPTVNRKESVIERELNSLSKATANLVNEASQLESRLSGILRTSPEKSTNQGETPRESLTPVADEIRRSKDTVDAVAFSIRGVLTRLDL